MSIVAMRSANLRKCGLNTCHGGMLPLFQSTDATLLQNPHFVILGTEPPKITTVLLQLEFSTGNQVPAEEGGLIEVRCSSLVLP